MSMFVKEWAVLTLIGGLIIFLIGLVALLIKFKKSRNSDLIYYVYIFGGFAITFFSYKLTV